MLETNTRHAHREGKLPLPAPFAATLKIKAIPPPIRVSRHHVSLIARTISQCLELYLLVLLIIVLLLLPWPHRLAQQQPRHLAQRKQERRL